MGPARGDPGARRLLRREVIGRDPRAQCGALETEGRAVSPQAIFEALQGFQVTAVVGTAIRLGLFDAIAGGSTSAEALAETVGADARGLRVLLDALAIIGFISAEGDELKLTPVPETFLVRAGGA